MFALKCLVVCVCISLGRAVEPVVGCRYRSINLRQDGGLCFEIPPWQHQPVELDDHVEILKSKWGANVTNNRRQLMSPTALENGDISRYLDTVLAPFLDTYHRNIQTSYQQQTTKTLTRTKDEINEAAKKKQQIYTELMQLANELNVPAMCEEERRNCRTTASKHVAEIYRCSETSRISIAKMGKYGEDMIGITKNHMQNTLTAIAKNLGNTTQKTDSDRRADIKASLKRLSRTAVLLGYELDLSLTNARRHSEQSCERLSSCTSRVKKLTQESVSDLKAQLNQCVYA